MTYISDSDFKNLLGKMSIKRNNILKNKDILNDSVLLNNKITSTNLNYNYHIPNISMLSNNKTILPMKKSISDMDIQRILDSAIKKRQKLILNKRKKAL
jgi:hypothetical protein